MNDDEYRQWLEETGQAEPSEEDMDEMERQYRHDEAMRGASSFGDFLAGVDLSRDVVPVEPELGKSASVEQKKKEERVVRDEDVRERRLRGIAGIGPDEGGQRSLGDN